MLISLETPMMASCTEKYYGYHGDKILGPEQFGRRHLEMHMLELK